MKGEPKGRAQLAAVLVTLVRTLTLVGLLGVTFGPAYTYTAVRLVYSERWSETAAPQLLAWYTGYLLLAAVNGVTEAFVNAVRDHGALSQSNYMMVVLSIGHMALSIVLSRWLGPFGLLAADAVNMALRITYSCSHIHVYFRQVEGFRLTSLMPRGKTLSVCAMAGLVVQVSQRHLISQQQKGFLLHAASHVLVGGVTLTLLCCALYWLEHELIASMKRLTDRVGKKEA